MNDMQHVGVTAKLEVAINAKVYKGADGRSVCALQDLSFDLREGTFTTVIGPSGCGKTTLLRIIAGLDPIYEGRVGGAIARYRIGFVFQEPRLLPWRTVGENIALGSFEKIDENEIKRLAALAGIESLVSRFPGELSLGQARRVSLARAMAARPRLLLLDEPFVSLDEATAQRLRQVLLDIWSEQKLTVLMVSHDVREAIQLSDQLLVISQQPGRVVAKHVIELPRGERNADGVEKLRRKILGTDA